MQSMINHFDASICNNTASKEHFTSKSIKTITHAFRLISRSLSLQPGTCFEDLKINSRADSACDSFCPPALLPALAAHCCAEGMLCHKGSINQPTSKAVMQRVHLWFLCWHWLLALGKPRVSAALLCKDSPCSLNNSKDDVCVTPRCHTWLMKSSAWSPGSTTPIASPLGLQYWELGKSCLFKAETQQKNHITQHNRSFILKRFILPDSSSRLTSDAHACFWLSTDPAQEEKEKPATSCSHWSVSGPSMPAWECVRLPLLWNVSGFCISAQIMELLVTAKICPQFSGV